MRQPNWNEYEAALLIDAYWKVRNKQIDRKAAVSSLSSLLRGLARQQIDEEYRNENGINMQLNQIDALFSDKERETLHVSNLFRKMTELYANNRDEYDVILAEAQTMAENEICVKDMFQSWMEKYAPKLRFDNVCKFLAVGEAFCLEHGIIQKPLFETTDVQTVKQFVKTVVNNKIFRIKNKRTYSEAAVMANWYYAFIRELPVVELDKDLTIDDASLVQTTRYDDERLDQKEEATIQEKSENASFEEPVEVIQRAIEEQYASGIRFDDTALRLLEYKIQIEIGAEEQEALKKRFFKRKDGLYFSPKVAVNEYQQQMIAEQRMLEELDKLGCIDLRALWNQFRIKGQSACLRDENDLEDFLMFKMPNSIRFAYALKTRIIKRIGVSVSEAVEKACKIIVEAIETRACVTQEDLLADFPFFTEESLKELLEKYTDRIVPIEINDFWCYQTIETLGFDRDFSEKLDSVLDELDELSISPTVEVIHAFLSKKIGRNLRREYSIPDEKTFRRIVSVYYTGSKKRDWKSGRFMEVADEDV